MWGVAGQSNEFRDSVGFAKIAVAINWDSQQPSPDDEEDSRKYRQEYQPLKIIDKNISPKYIDKNISPQKYLLNMSTSPPQKNKMKMKSK